MDNTYLTRMPPDPTLSPLAGPRNATRAPEDHLTVSHLRCLSFSTHKITAVQSRLDGDKLKNPPLKKVATSYLALKGPSSISAVQSGMNHSIGRLMDADGFWLLWRWSSFNARTWLDVRLQNLL